jgi:hypothetical protein
MIVRDRRRIQPRSLWGQFVYPQDIAPQLKP